MKEILTDKLAEHTTERTVAAHSQMTRHMWDHEICCTGKCLQILRTKLDKKLTWFTSESFTRPLTRLETVWNSSSVTSMKSSALSRLSQALSSEGSTNGADQNSLFDQRLRTSPSNRCNDPPFALLLGIKRRGGSYSQVWVHNSFHRYNCNSATKSRQKCLKHRTVRQKKYQANLQLWKTRAAPDSLNAMFRLLREKDTSWDKVSLTYTSLFGISLKGEHESRVLTVRLQLWFWQRCVRKRYAQNTGHFFQFFWIWLSILQNTSDVLGSVWVWVTRSSLILFTRLTLTIPVFICSCVNAPQRVANSVLKNSIASCVKEKTATLDSLLCQEDSYSQVYCCSFTFSQTCSVINEIRTFCVCWIACASLTTSAYSFLMSDIFSNSSPLLICKMDSTRGVLNFASVFNAASFPPRLFVLKLAGATNWKKGDMLVNCLQTTHEHLTWPDASSVWLENSVSNLRDKWSRSASAFSNWKCKFGHGPNIPRIPPVLWQHSPRPQKKFPQRPVTNLFRAHYAVVDRLSLHKTDGLLNTLNVWRCTPTCCWSIQTVKLPLSLDHNVAAAASLPNCHNSMTTSGVPGH